MGAKRRLANTGRGKVSNEVLDRFAVKNPASFQQWKWETSLKAGNPRRKAKKESV